MSKQLTSTHSEKLRDAILEAYRKPEDFSEMLRLEKLDRFEVYTSMDSNYKHGLFEFIDQMSSRGKAETLIRSACNRRIDNQDLLRVCNEILSELGLEECKSGVLGSEQRPRPVEPGWEDLASVQPHNFDLTPLIDECLPHLLGTKGLKAFLVPLDLDEMPAPAALLKNFCERIRAELEDPSKVLITHAPLSLMPSLAGVAVSAALAIDSLDNLSEGDVILQVTASDEATALEFWKRITAEYADKDINFRGIAIIIVNTKVELLGSDQVIVLPKPKCEHLDIYRWVNAVVTALQWPRDAITIWHWEDLIEQKCTRGILQFHMVYGHLESALKHLHANPSYNDFQRDYLERKQIP